MLIAASNHRCLAEMLIVASFLEIQDPRERPSAAQTQADQAHATFADPRSDFIAVLNVWKAFQTKSDELSGSQLRKWCREYFLSFVRMREWQELYRQLAKRWMTRMRANQQAADYADLHRRSHWLSATSARSKKARVPWRARCPLIIAPGTPLASKPPKWVVAAASWRPRAYLHAGCWHRTAWIERSGDQLLKRAYTNHSGWSRRLFGALESVSLLV